MNVLKWLFYDTSRYEESTLDLLKRKSVAAGLDPTFWDEIAGQPCCPGSLGPGDPGRLNGCKPDCPSS